MTLQNNKILVANDVFMYNREIKLYMMYVYNLSVIFKIKLKN